MKKLNYISKNCYDCDELNEFRLNPSHKVDKLERKKIWDNTQSPTAIVVSAQNLKFMTGVSGSAAGINGIILMVCGVNGNGVGVQSIRFTSINRILLGHRD